MEEKQAIQVVATWARPPPNPQAIRSPIPFFLLDLLPGLASLPPVQYASSFRVQRPKLVSSCLAVKSEQSNFSALHTNHEGSLLHSREHLSCAFIPYQNWMTQNMVLNFVKAQLRVIGAKFWPVPTNDGVAWSSGPARDWFWALLTAVKILIKRQEGHSFPLVSKKSFLSSTFFPFSSPVITVTK